MCTVIRSSAEALGCSQGCCRLRPFLPTAGRRPALAKATSRCPGLVNKNLWTMPLEPLWGCWALLALLLRAHMCMTLPADRSLVADCSRRSISMRLRVLICGNLGFGEPLSWVRPGIAECASPVLMLLGWALAWFELLLRNPSCAEEMSGFQGIFKEK